MPVSIVVAMRSIWRTLGARRVRDIVLICLAVGLTAVSYGAISVTAGLPAWAPPLIALVVLAGSAEFLFVGILAAGGGVAAAVAAALLVNARHLPYGMASRRLVGEGSRRLLGAHIMNDESVLLGLAQRDPARGRAAYWATGLGVLVCWPAGAALGVVLGNLVGDTATLGLDAMFPAIIAGLVVPSLRAGKARRPALVGAGIALAATPFAPAGLPPLLALLGLLVHRRQRGSADGCRATSSSGATRDRRPSRA